MNQHVSNAELLGDPDYGDDLGPAFRARPSSIERVGAEWRGQFRDGGVDARVMRDATTHDLLLAARWITAAQHEAADRLYGWWCVGGFARSVTASYGDRIGGSAGDDGPTSADAYRAAVRAMPMHLAVYVDTLMLLEYRPANLAGIRQALDWCVKEWGL